MTIKEQIMRYILAFYEMDRAYGGPEEGGWWFDTGTLARVHGIERDEACAIARAARANRLLDRLQSGRRPISSLIYSGGRHSLLIFEHTAPPSFPVPGPNTNNRRRTIPSLSSGEHPWTDLRRFRR